MNKENFLDEEIRNDYTISTNIKKLWEIQLSIISEIDRICQKYEIEYFADGGTFLGAIRHQGFIPWDDDIDISMTRDNYEKFKQVVTKELNSNFFFQDNETEKNFFRVHGQVRKNNTTMMIKYDYGKKYHRGVFVDIFIYDKVPLAEKLDNKLRNKLELLRKILVYKNEVYETGIKKIIKNIIGNLGVLLFGGFNNTVKKFDKLCKKYNDLTDGYYYDLVGYYTNKRKLKFDKALLEEKTIYRKFEYLEIKTINDYDTYLTNMYGKDYMVPKQAPNDHGNVYIDIDNPYTIYDSLTREQFEDLFDGQKVKN